MDGKTPLNWFAARDAAQWREFALHCRDFEDAVDMSPREQAYMEQALLPAIKAALYLDAEHPGLTMAMVKDDPLVTARLALPDGAAWPLRVRMAGGADDDHQAGGAGLLTGAIAACYGQCNAAANDHAPESILLVDCSRATAASPLLDAETREGLKTFMAGLLAANPPRFARVLCTKASFVAVKPEDIIFDSLRTPVVQTKPPPNWKPM